MTNGKENEDKDCPPAFKKFNPWIKFGAGLFSLILLVGGVLWGMTSTFAMKPEVIQVKEEAAKERQLIAEKAVETFQIFQKSYEKDQELTRQEQRRSQTKIDIRHWQQQLDDSYRNERYLRDDLQKNPNNNSLQDRIQEEQRLQQVYRQKIDKLLEGP